MAWVNGRGYQRACSYRHHAAVAEMPVAFRSQRPGRPDVVLFVPALTSRTAGYVTRMSGAVGGALSDGRPYPYGRPFFPKNGSQANDYSTIQLIESSASNNHLRVGHLLL